MPTQIDSIVDESHTAHAPIVEDSDFRTVFRHCQQLLSECAEICVCGDMLVGEQLFISQTSPSGPGVPRSRAFRRIFDRVAVLFPPLASQRPLQQVQNTLELLMIAHNPIV